MKLIVNILSKLIIIFTIFIFIMSIILNIKMCNYIGILETNFKSRRENIDTIPFIGSYIIDKGQIRYLKYKMKPIVSIMKE